MLEKGCTPIPGAEGGEEGAVALAMQIQRFLELRDQGQLEGGVVATDS